MKKKPGKKQKRDMRAQAERALVWLRSSQKKGFAWSDLILVLGLFIMSVSFLIKGQYDAWTGEESVAWPSTRGEVVRNEVVCNTYTTRSRSGRLVPPITTRHYSCALVVTYGYDVQGRTYTSKRFSISLGEADAFSSSDRKRCEQWGRENYPAGKKVRVFYDPDAPDQAVLEPGVTFSTLVMLVLGPLMAGVGFFFVLLAAPMKRRPSLPLRLLYSVAVVLVLAAISILALPSAVRERWLF